MKIEVYFNSDSLNILDETLKLLSAVREVKITKIILRDSDNKQDFYNYCKSFSNDAILLFDNLENYLKFADKMNCGKSETNSELNHLIYCEGLQKSKIEEILTQKTFQTFLLYEDDQITLNAMTQFTKHTCGVKQLVEINRFIDSERKWLTEKFLLLTYENFHGCELWIGYGDKNGLPFSNFTSFQDKNTSIEGILVKLVEALSTHLNFTFNHFPEDRDQVSPDLTFDVYTIQGSEFGFPLTGPICSTSSVFIVPPGKTYCSWEKLFMPFDRETWKWLAASFIIAFLVILLTKLSKSSSINDFVIGTNVSSPALNVIGIFMGIGQIMLPRRNIARFLFTNFLLFCLIMRTAYQGKYFEFLTSDMTKKPIGSIEELKRKNFTVYQDIRFSVHESEILEG